MISHEHVPLPHTFLYSAFLRLGGRHLPDGSICDLAFGLSLTSTTTNHFSSWSTTALTWACILCKSLNFYHQQSGEICSMIYFRRLQPSRCDVHTSSARVDHLFHISIVLLNFCISFWFHLYLVHRLVLITFLQHTYYIFLYYCASEFSFFHGALAPLDCNLLDSIMGWIGAPGGWKDDYRVFKESLLLLRFFSVLLRHRLVHWECKRSCFWLTTWCVRYSNGQKLEPKRNMLYWQAGVLCVATGCKG